MSRRTGITEEDIKAKVFASPDVIRYVNPTTTKKFIYIKNKIVSISV